MNTNNPSKGRDGVSSWMDFQDDPQQVHNVMGVLYGMIGFFAIILNGRNLLRIKRDRTHWEIFGSKLIHVNFALASIGLVLGTPFSAISCFYGKWIFSDNFCKWRAFEAMVSGLACLYSLYFLCLDRFLSIHYQLWYKRNGTLLMVFLVLSAWLISTLISCLPFVGYGRYCVEPEGTSCLIDWTVPDFGNRVFIFGLAIFVFLIPVMSTGFILVKAQLKLRQENKTSTASGRMNRLGMGLLMFELIAWTPYAILCVISVSMPHVKFSLLVQYLCTLSPKFGAVFMPLIYSLILNNTAAKSSDGKPKITYTKSGRAKKIN